MTRTQAPTRRLLRRGAAALAFAALLVAGCGDGAQGPSDPDQAFASEMVRLKGEVFFEGEQLGSPGEMARVGDHLVVLDGISAAAVHVFRADGSHERSFGRTGSGPREFRNPRYLDPVPGSGDEFWIFDQQLLRFTHVDLRRDTLDVGRRSITFQGNELPMGPVWLGDTLIASPGLYPSGRLAQYDSAGRFRRVVGPFPGEEDDPAPVVQHAYTGTLLARPDRGRLALLNRHADRLELYGPDGGLVRMVTGPMGFKPVYRAVDSQGAPVMATTDDLRFGYISGAATGRHLFALFSGRSRAERPGRAYYGSFVRVFDWEGRQKAVFKLDAYIFAIAVSPDERTLYAVRHEPEPAILTYALPPVP